MVDVPSGRHRQADPPRAAWREGAAADNDELTLPIRPADDERTRPTGRHARDESTLDGRTAGPIPRAPGIADPLRVPSNRQSGTQWQPQSSKHRRRRRRAKHRRHEREASRPFLKELPILIVTALVLTFVIQTFIGRVYMIPSGSMETTLHGCPGCTPDRVLVDKVVYRFGDVEPGEVVVFRGPDKWSDATSGEEVGGVMGVLQQLGGVVGLAPADNRNFVKRVIAVGGQTVACCDKQNRVTVDGEPLDELSYLHLVGGDKQAEFKPVKVPEGSVFVMGDNRNNSSDSRYQGGGGVNGTVPADNIIGKARAIVLPADRWAGIDGANPQEK